MPNPGENSAGFQVGAAYAFTQNPKTNQAALPISLRTSSADIPFSASDAASKTNFSLQNQSSVPQGPPPSSMSPIPQHYTLNLADTLNVGEGSTQGASQVAKSNFNAKQADLQQQVIKPAITGYQSGFDQNGNRYQKPIYENTPAASPLDVSETVKSLAPPASLDGLPLFSKGYSQATGKPLTEGELSLGNGLISLSNQQISERNAKAQQQNQVITNSNNVIAGNNAIDKLANQDIISKNAGIALSNGLSSLFNQEQQAKQDTALRQIVSGAAIGNANQLDIFNKGVKIGSIPVNKNSFESLKAITSENNGPLSVKAVNTNAQEAERQNALNTINYIRNAKAQGITSLDILGPSKIGGAFGSSGEKIGTTTPDQAFNALKSYSAKGIPVSLSYQKPTVQNEAESFIKFPFLGEKTSSVPIPLNEIPAGTGKSFLGIVSGNPVEKQTSAPAYPTFGTALITAPVIKNNNVNVGSTSLADVGGFLPIGGISSGAKTAASSIAGLKAGLEAKGTVQQIAKGILETEVSKPLQGTAKVTKGLYEISAGTEGRSITPTSKFQKIVNIFRLPTEKYVSGFGKVATQEGKVGATVPIEPSQVKIPTQQGEAEIPLTFVQPEKGGITAIIPKEISPSVKESTILVKGNPASETITALGLTPVKGSTNLFIGKVTPQISEHLQSAIDNGLITKEANAFQYPTSVVKENPSVYAQISKEPKLLEGNQLDVLTGKVSAKFPAIVRPDILGLYRVESKGFESPKGLTYGPESESYGSRGLESYLNGFFGVEFKPVVNPLTGKVEELRAFESVGSRPRKGKIASTPFSFGVGESKVGAGSSGKAKALLNEKTESLLKDYFKPATETPKEKSVGDYLGLTKPLSAREQRQQNQISSEYETIAYPPGTKSELAGKSIQGIKISNDILQGIKERQSTAEKAGTIYKLGSELQTRQNNLSKTISVSDVIQKGKQGTSLDVGSMLGTQQAQGQKQLTTPIQSLRFDLGQTGRYSQTQEQTPLQTQKPAPLLDLVPLQDLIPQKTTPDIPIFGGWGGGFSWGFGLPQRKKKHSGNRVVSFAAYSVNPNVVGAIEQAGLPGLQVSGSKNLFGKIDVQLAKATNKQRKSKIKFDLRF